MKNTMKNIRTFLFRQLRLYGAQNEMYIKEVTRKLFNFNVLANFEHK